MMLGNLRFWRTVLPQAEAELNILIHAFTIELNESHTFVGFV